MVLMEIEKTLLVEQLLQDTVLLGNDKVFQILFKPDLDFDIKDNNGRNVILML